VSAPINEVAARGFERAGPEYERGRPGYPPEAIELLSTELQLGPARTVVDLAAGTGKLTRALSATGARIVAVEPVAGMREQLLTAVPGVQVLDGTAEAIPLADASADAVLVAQAFHWFDARAAAAEIHRVLSAGGGLGILWNSWNESYPWVARMQEVIHSYAGDTPRHDTSRWREQLAATGLFTTLREATFPYVVSGDRAALLARVASVSYISALEDAERGHVIAAVRAIVSTDPLTREGGELQMPYTTHVAWARALPALSPRG
jgi:SAM-dependent methyltransferase